MAGAIPLTGRERTFNEDDIIVSKTDLKGRLIYANDIFLDIAGYSEAETIGQPHSFIRHPEMPRCIFKLLWDTIQDKREIFAYVVNRCKNGDHYWVLAHVTPTIEPDGSVSGYHSNRRVPRKESLNVIQPLYSQLLAEEGRHANKKDGLAASEAMLQGMLRDKGTRYDKFILSI